jgi:prevent-host-death family protein
MNGVELMATYIKPSAAIRQNYNEIADLCKSTGEPVYLTKNGEGDLVVMDIDSFDQRTKRLELREKLLEIAEQRNYGIQGVSAKEISERLRERIQERKNAIPG